MTPIELGLDTFGDVTVDARRPAAVPRPGHPRRRRPRPSWPTRSASTSSASASTTAPTSPSRRPKSCSRRSPPGPTASGSAPRSPCSAPTTRSASSSASPRSTRSRTAAPRSSSAAARSPSRSRSSAIRLERLRARCSRRSSTSSPRSAMRSHGRAGAPGRARRAPPLEGQRVYPPRRARPLRTWVGVGGSPESVVRAARYGLPLDARDHRRRPARFAPLRRPLPPGARRSSGSATLPIGVHSPGHVADDRRAGARASSGRTTEVDARPHRPRSAAGRPMSRASSSARSAAGSLYVGSPETVARKIAATVRDARRVPLRPQVQRGHAVARADAAEHRAVRPRSDPARAGAAGGGRRAGGEVSGRRGSGGLDGPALRARSRPDRRGRRRRAGAPPLARPRAARGALGLPPLLARRAPQHAGHRERRDRGGDRPRRRGHLHHPRRRRRDHAAEPRAARDRRAVRHARLALSRGASTSASAARRARTSSPPARCGGARWPPTPFPRTSSS